ncbi:hypothetical protein ACPWSR_05895 [Alloiococcus sp. CFN-8]|uniref:hypothetical protein n=1 Tax=Alloiococcus sp. CFN-8 TaxID=3416081 RepID=UPI003CF49D2F
MHSFPINSIILLLIIPVLLVIVEYFLAKMKDPIAGLILPILCGISLIFTAWYGPLLSIFLFITYFVTRNNKAKENKGPTDMDKMNIEDLS